MQNSNGEENAEINHYVEIIDYFEAIADRNKREIFRDKYLAKLMTKLKQDSQTQNIIRNCIVIMNVLINEKIPPDRYIRVGWSQEDLSKKDKRLLKKMLKNSIKVK